MKVVELTGVVEIPETNGDPVRIGGEDLISKVTGAFWPAGLNPHLTWMLAYGGQTKCYEGGTCAVDGEPTYSSWTPGGGPTIMVGGVDVYENLCKLDGALVHLRVDDGATPSEGAASAWATE